MRWLRGDRQRDRYRYRRCPYLAADGALHVYSGEAAALTVVRSDGRTVYAASIAPGDTRLALPSGIYMVRINNITYKIAL